MHAKKQLKRERRKRKAARKIREMGYNPEEVVEEVKEAYSDFQRGQESRRKQGKWGHPKTVYPEDYDGPRQEDIDYIKRQDKHKHHEEKELTPSEQEKEDRKTVKKYKKKHAKTVYPKDYKPPQHSPDPPKKSQKGMGWETGIYEESFERHFEQPRAPMVMKQITPY